jgi:hypothetical protein
MALKLKLIIGNKNYSSWSFRPWIAMKVAGIAFEEEVISLEASDFKARVGKVSGTGKVPALVDGNVHVWESLAILEYLAEKYPHAHLWPADPAARALARAIAAEMHAGFGPLRRHLPMNMWRPVTPRQLTPEVECPPHRGDLDRLPQGLWWRRRVSVRRLRRRGCDVCARCLPLPHLWGGGRGHGSRVYGCGNGAAGLERMARGCARGALGAGGRRGGLAEGRAGMTGRVPACDIPPKKCRGNVLIPGRGRQKTTPNL